MACYRVEECVEEAIVDPVIALVESTGDVEQRTLQGETALMRAASDGNLAVVRYLIEAGAQVDAVDDYRRTALQCASFVRGKFDLIFDVVQFLVKCGANANASNHRGGTSLHNAAMSGNVNVVRYLVECGADINVSNELGDTPFLYAATGGNMEIIRFLIKVGANIHAVGSTRQTALLSAVKYGHLELARFLLANGANIEAVEQIQQTALIIATDNKNLEMVRFLVENKANINATDLSKQNALMYAVLRGHVEITKFLVKHGANIHAVDAYGSTALNQRVWKTNFEIIKFLIENGADVNTVEISGENVLMRASDCGDSKTVRLLVKNGADVNVADNHKWTPFMFAAAKRNLNVARYLVASGAKTTDWGNNEVIKKIMYGRKSGGVIRYLLGENGGINVGDEFGITLLMYAAALNRMDIVQLLVQRGADVNATDDENCTALLHAANGSHWDVARFLVRKGANVNAVDKSGFTVLIHAARWEYPHLQYHVETVVDVRDDDKYRLDEYIQATRREHQFDIVPYLIEAGANVNAADKSGSTALIHAARWEHQFDIIPYLVDAGANVNASTTSGCTSLLYAAQTNRVDIVRLLVEAGADVNFNNNRTALIIASGMGNFAVVQYLVDSGAGVNTVDSDGLTALIHASKNGNLDVIKFLSHSGAKIDVTGKDGWTALMYAVQNGSLDVVQFLLVSGADVNIVNNDGHTSIFIATNNDYTDIQRLLLQHIRHFHQITGASHTQLPINCFISPFEVKLLQFIESQNVGGNYRALWLDTEVAVKLFVPEVSATTFAHEVAVWHQLRHPNVIKLYGACDVGHHFFVCEWASNGSLFEYLSACETRGERRTPWKFLYEAALGLAYLHERKIVHGNLSNNSILIGNDGLAKLADFQVSGSATIPSGGRQDGCFGSLRWNAPERLKGEVSSLASDIYSFCLCVMAAVTLKIPWDDGFNGYKKSDHEIWMPTTHHCKWNNPIKDEMTFDLKMLAIKMCHSDPHLRISATAVVRVLEQFAAQEFLKHRPSEMKSKLTAQISEYSDLLSQWQKLQDAASNATADQPELSVFHELETLYERLSTDTQPVVLLDQFYKLVADCIGAINFGSHQFRILQLSSTKAQGHTTTGIYRRIEAIWDAIDDTHGKEREQSRREQRLKQQEVFISEVSHTLVVLNELETDGARNALVAFLNTEIGSHGSSYTTDQLNVLQKACTDLNAFFKSDAVGTMPEWFLPWYELEYDGASFLAEGAFGEVYRAKWLESDVIVKRVKLPGSNSSDSWEDDSLLDGNVSQTQNTKQKRREVRKLFEHEVDVWFGLSHPHVVRLFGACPIGTPVFACEYASNGSLDRYLRKHPKEIWQKLHEAALGVQYLHSRDIIHGDLKCNNIVVGGDNKAKVTDFGLSSANVVTGAWRWVAPECLERGSSELSFASDIYALGMCIVEALRIVEKRTTNNKDYIPLPWGNLDNNVVKHRVIHLKELPSRPKLSTDDEWKLVKRMCAYNPKGRTKISTVVDELGALASVDKLLSPEMIEPEPVIFSQEEVEKMKWLCSLEQQNQKETSSTNQVVLHSVYGLLWDRFQDICVMPNVEFGCLQPLFDCARVSTQKLKQCTNTLTSFTEMAINGYALHRELDKIIEAKFWSVDYTSGGLHDWKSKCTAAGCTPGLVSM